MGGGSSTQREPVDASTIQKENESLKKALRNAQKKLVKVKSDLEEKQIALEAMVRADPDCSDGDVIVAEDTCESKMFQKQREHDQEDDESEIEVAELFKKIAPHGKLQAGYSDADGDLENLLICKGVEKADLLKKLDSDPEGMSQAEFLAWLLYETEMEAKEAFVEQIELSSLLAAKLPGGNLNDPLAGVQALTPAGVGKVCKAVAMELSIQLLQCVEKLKSDQEEDTDVPDLGRANSKFALQQNEEQPELVFGKMSDFQGGLQARIGVPHPNIMSAIEKEHTGREDSQVEFTTDNYEITTTPEAEFALVADKDKRHERSKSTENGRRVLYYVDVLEFEQAGKAGLTAPEALALILYTGPMYLKYNAVLRQYPRAVLAGNQGNRYINTITAVVSGIKKLSVVAPLPKDRIVYRGVAGRKLPKRFTYPDERGVCGGVELGLMSTTTRAKTALQYAQPVKGWNKNKTLPMLFQISLGAVDTGASLDMLSQYPEEREILFPPLSYMERVGEIEVVRMRGVWVRLVPIRISVNDQSDTVEAILAQRRQMISTIADFSYYEVSNDLDSLAAAPLLDRLAKDKAAVAQAEELDPEDVSSGLRAVRHRFLDRCRSDFESFVASQREKHNEVFNQDEMFLRVLTDVLDFKEAALHKVNLYLADKSMPLTSIEDRSLKVVRRMLLAQLKDDVRAARKAKSKSKLVEAAARLAKETGRLVHSVEENIDGRSVLGAATEDGDSAGISLLIQAGADPNLADDCDGRTALALAAELDDTECVAALLRGGAEADQRNAVDGATALHTAAHEGHTEIAETLLQAGGSVNAEHQEGWTPLHYAAQEGHAECGRVLVSWGAAVQAAIYEDAAMSSPLHLAAAGGHDEMAQVLLEAKADASAMDRGGNTALHLAALGGFGAVVRRLLAAGAAADQTNIEGLHLPGVTMAHASTPLMMAAAGGHAEACKELLAAHANPAFKMEGGVTALQGAACAGSKEVAKLLVDANADPDVVAQDAEFGGKAAEVAEQRGFVEVAEYLKSLTLETSPVIRKPKSQKPIGSAASVRRVTKK